jgi:outer membrane biosynthesis protein TonB
MAREVDHNVGSMRMAFISLGIAAAIAPGVAGAAPGPSGAVRPRGLSLEQIRGVMRAHATEFNTCYIAARRHYRQLQGPFVYQIEVDRKGKVSSARPYQPSGVTSFDRCITDVLLHARFPGGPASVEAPLVFDPS